MGKTISLNQEQQQRATLYVRDSFSSYDELMKSKREDWLRIYKAVSTFREEKKADWQTQFKVNKAFEIENKVLPSIVARDPRWDVSLKTDEWDPVEALLSDEEKASLMTKRGEFASWIQDYLYNVFASNGQTENSRLWAKMQIRYGIGWAKVKYKYQTSRSSLDEQEKVIGEYPCIEIKSWTDMYYDPRYQKLEDMPGLIELKTNVRYAELKKNKKDYMNIDKIKDCIDGQDYVTDPESYKRRVYQLSGINQTDRTKGITKNNLTLKIFYGFFDLNDDGDEKLYEIATIDDVFCISCKEITQIPFEEIKCFEDPETFYADGFLAPIISIQDEYNFKINSASESINQSLNPTRIWSPMSGIDPRDAFSGPGGIIVTTASGQEALENFPELSYREVNQGFFAEQGNFDRLIQSLSFTVDTTNSAAMPGQDQTATGQRIGFYERNKVLDQIRKQFEQGLVRLAYKLLQETYDNLENNTIIKSMGSEQYAQANKELFKDALMKYNIRVEPGSSSYDTADQRRADAIALHNISLSSAQAGVPVKLQKSYEDVLSKGFDVVNPQEYIQQPNPMAQMMGQQQPAQPGGVPSKAPLVPAAPTDPASLTQQVSGGKL